VQAPLRHLLLPRSAIDSLINAPERGDWDDQFDAKAASRTATSIVSNTPILGPQSVSSIQQAIGQYQQIASSGGWPQVNPGEQRLQIGVSDQSVQALRQRLAITGDLPREAGMSSSFDSYVDGAVKRFQARHGLPSDGVIGEFTLKAMNIPADVRLQQLNTNLIRLQTFPQSSVAATSWSTFRPPMSKASKMAAS
jgi:murein L,D-transpeptidase YcbB/YkuD